MGGIIYFGLIYWKSLMQKMYGSTVSTMMCFEVGLHHSLFIPTQDTKPSLGRRPKDGFVSKWVYNFLPSQNHVHLSGYFKHHIGGGQLPKNRCKIL